MTTVAHAAQLLRDALKLSEDASRYNKVERLEFAQAGMTAAIGFLDEVVAAHPDVEAEKDTAFQRGLELGRNEAATEPAADEIACDGPLFINAPADDEIDEDPPTIEDERSEAYCEGHGDGFGEGVASQQGDNDPDSNPAPGDVGEQG